ncbi:hypothetical protein [Paenibacillus methanolicus]|uniref:Uncharacterized protein n=1 Tax=Paenibacillus methanolicus TaxID=582686 RepID=A0A5S5CJ54_9BACL|nr:hypothetical protein [Paenibacillus methanolicus]TYP78043.1 hypothetical protein BCM02_102619 [Paenibacillus methanolicus]
MRKQPLKWGIVGGMIVLMVMFGIDVATSGVERIYGPVEQQEASPVASQGAGISENAGLQPEPGYYPRERAQEPVVPVYRPTVGEAQRYPERAAEADARAYELQERENERLPGIPDLRDDTTVDKLADGTAGALQSLSSQGIRFVVSLFESVTD